MNRPASPPTPGNHDTHRRIEETVALTTHVLRKIPEAISVIDEDGRYVEVSDRYCRIVGYDRCRLIGASAIALLFPQADHDHLLDQHRRFLAGSHVPPSSACVHTGRGDTVAVRAEARRLTLPDGRRLRTTILRHVTDPHEVERERRLFAQAMADLIHPVIITDCEGHDHPRQRRVLPSLRLRQDGDPVQDARDSQRRKGHVPALGNRHRGMG